ncbi:MAG TPA: terminase family protein [Candidatus Acidoferrum sp.]|nr:terminase family protein [Candidatus Acidoferrum sp.]
MRKRNRERKHEGPGARPGNLNRLLGKDERLGELDLESEAGLQAVLKEVASRTFRGKMNYRRASAITSAVQLLLERMPSKQASASTSPAGDESPDTSGGADPVGWLATHLAWTPFTYQAELLRDHAVHLRVIRKSRQVGITTALAMEAVWKAYTTPGRTILIVSPSDRQSKILMGRIEAAVEADPTLSEQVARKNLSEFWLKNGSAILSLPNNPDRIRGFSATDIYLDEAAHFLNDAPVMAAIKPMLIATKGTFTIASTPFGKRGLFYDQYLIAVNEQSSRADVKAYDIFPSTKSPLVTAEMLELERLNLTELEFKQEYEGQFVEQVDVYLPLPLITSCVDSDLTLLETGQLSSEYVAGVDFAKQRDETVVILLEEEKVGNESVYVLRHISAWSGMEYSEQLGRIRNLTKTFKINRITADQTGVGQPVIEGLREIIPNVEPYNFTMESKAELASALRMLLEQKRLRLPNERKLIMQMNGLTYKVSKTGNLLFESPEKVRLHDDYLWALALACHAATSAPVSTAGLFILGHARRQE